MRSDHKRVSWATTSQRQCSKQFRVCLWGRGSVMGLAGRAVCLLAFFVGVTKRADFHGTDWRGWVSLHFVTKGCAKGVLARPGAAWHASVLFVILAVPGRASPCQAVPGRAKGVLARSLIAKMKGKPERARPCHGNLPLFGQPQENVLEVGTAGRWRPHTLQKQTAK